MGLAKGGAANGVGPHMLHRGRQACIRPIRAVTSRLISQSPSQGNPNSTAAPVNLLCLSSRLGNDSHLARHARRLRPPALAWTRQRSNASRRGLKTMANSQAKVAAFPVQRMRRMAPWQVVVL
ncbi:hypothetical protein QR685DRAFT_512060 [Neurospora intermedia]|uniref:Uncharacterized protein n=1 Tax=Neurospora intermedia TaxID=5142 RepID=A0ABR3DRC6_NEUIN